MPRHMLIAAALCLTLPAFAQGRRPEQREAKPEVERETPGERVGLDKREIPPATQAALDAPYSRRNTTSCAAIAAEVRRLNTELGSDLDAGKSEDDDSDVEYYAKRTGQALLGPIGMIGDVVGEVTGARKSRDRLRAAIAAGVARRAYLKGVGQARGCRAPAAPTAAAQAAVPKPPASSR